MCLYDTYIICKKSYQDIFQIHNILYNKNF